MFDGIKIQVGQIDGVTWSENPYLSFYAYTNVDTGDIPSGSKKAEYKGLHFIVTPTRNEVRGSINRYFHNGGHNANDLTLSQVESACNSLRHNFGIRREVAQLRNVEFGVTIELPCPVSEVLTQIICLPNKRFVVYEVQGSKIGLVCVRSQYEVKIYDKCKQSNLNGNNLLRFEVRIKRMAALKKKSLDCKVETLADLYNPANAMPLLGYLLDLFDDVIWYDNSIDFKELNHRDQIRIMRYKNPLEWEEMTKHQRRSFRPRVEKIIESHGANSLKKLVRKLIVEKWISLINESGKVATFLPTKEADTKTKGDDLSTRIYVVKKSPTTMTDTAPKVKRCLTCKRDISHQSPLSKFCSEKYYGKQGKKCRNKASNDALTQRRREARRKEKERLEKMKERPKAFAPTS